MNEATRTDRFWFTVMTATSAGACKSAVDVIQDARRPGSIAVLLSRVKDEGQRILECQFALTNVIAWGDQFRERGIPSAETCISVIDDAGTIEVRSPLRSMTDEDEDSTAPLLITLTGVRLGQPGDNEEASGSFPIAYAQRAYSPAVGSPAREVFVVPDTVSTSREVLAERKSDVRMHVHETLLPQLRAYSGLSFGSTIAWSGAMDGSLESFLQKAAQVPPPVPKLKVRPKALVATGYRFADVEFVGMRIDLRPYGSRADDLLEQMIEPLNFHLKGSDPADAMAFRYQPAARTLVIELVRYGRMYWGEDVPTDGLDYFESQYELLIRVLVGRVDDGSAQARDPAVFVPAIFVDNPWSKVIGREFQGFEKRMARFLDKRGRRLDSTASRDGTSSGLFDVAHVEQLASLAHRAPGSTGILDIDLPRIDADWYENADPVDSFGVSLIAGPRWRQSDFSHREFRRSFARNVLADGMDSFHSIQVSPVDSRPLPPAWITGTFTLRGLRAAFPQGIATLNLKAHEGLPHAFKGLCKLMNNEPVVMPTGDWYIGKSSVDLKVDDGLL